MEYDKPDSGRKEKAPSLLQIIKDTKEVVKNKKVKADAEIEIVAAGQRKDVAEKHLLEAGEAFFSSKKDTEVRSKAAARIKAASRMRLDCAKRIDKANTVLSEAKQQKLKGTIKLG
jgi:hypothetical protein